jgi:hypothetical protein
VIASILGDNLSIANLGDSALLVFRPPDKVFFFLILIFYCCVLFFCEALSTIILFQLLFQSEHQAIGNMPFQIGPKHQQFLHKAQLATLVYLSNILFFFS